MPSPDKTRSLVVIIGASRFPRAPELCGGSPFSRSVEAFAGYLNADDGFGLQHSNLLDLFDDNRPATQQLEEISQFLQEKQRGESIALENLLIYYVGHGLFTPNDRKYCLALRSTNGNNIGLSAMRGRDLAEVVSTGAAHLRRFLIFDCCFAGSMLGEFLSAPGEAANVQMIEELPAKGTTMLCASSSQAVALSPARLDYTMFSDALLKVLREGNPTLGEHLSMGELKATIQSRLQRDYPQNWVRPEVHSPDMRQGDISSVPLFPNRAYRPAGADCEAQATKVTQSEFELKNGDDTERLSSTSASSERIEAENLALEQGKMRSCAETLPESSAQEKVKRPLSEHFTPIEGERVQATLIREAETEESLEEQEKSVVQSVNETAVENLDVQPKASESKSPETKQFKGETAGSTLGEVFLRRRIPIIVCFLLFIAAVSLPRIFVRTHSNQIPAGSPHVNQEPSPSNASEAGKDNVASEVKGDTKSSKAPSGPKSVIKSPQVNHLPSRSNASEAGKDNVASEVKGDTEGRPGPNRVVKNQPSREQLQLAVWTDPATSLTWTRRDSTTGLTWQEAKNYCHTMNLSGFSDWRLPSAGELDTLYNPQASVPSIGIPKKSPMHVKGGLQLSGFQWSADSTEKGFGLAKNFAGNFLENVPGFAIENWQEVRALCVRNAAPK